MRKLLALLLLLAAPAAAQIETTPPSSTSSGGGGGAFITPLAGPTGCASVAYGFSGAAAALGLCSATGASATVQSAAAGSRASTSWGSTNATTFFNDGGAGNTTFVIGDNSISGTNESAQSFTFDANAFSSALPFRAPDGAVGAPSLAWTSDADGTGTGFYRSAANETGIAVNGLNVGFFKSTGFQTGAEIRFCTGAGCSAQDVGISRPATAILGISDGTGANALGRLRTGDGTAASPSLQFSSGTNNGLYFASSRMNYAENGVFAGRFAGGFQVPSTQQFGFLSGTVESNSPDTGLRRSAAAVVAVSDAGATNLGRILTGGGSVTSPALGIGSSDGTNAQNGWYSTGVNGVGFTRNGALGFALGHIAGAEINLASTWSLTWSSGAATSAGDVGLARLGSNTSLRVSDGSSGYGGIIVKDGTAAGVGFGFQTGVGGTGFYYDTTANDALVTSKNSQSRAWVTGDRTLTDATATTVFTQALATAEMYGFTIDYTITAVNATPDYQVVTGTAHIAMQNKGGTETCGTITINGETTTASTGTLVLTAITCDTTGANAVAVQFNADSSLTTPTITFTAHIRRGGIGTGALTLS